MNSQWSTCARLAALGLAVATATPRADGAPGSATHAPAASTAQAAVHVFRLDNGITVLFRRVPGAAAVGVEEIYPVGLIDDPAGIAQGTHFVEHLRCMSASASFEAGASYARLNQVGLGNAETMADATHYDLVVPKADLPLALSIIAERLGSLRLEAAILAQEAPRCYAEIAGVTRMTGGPGFKFSLAAAVQSWRHGRDRADILSGLEEWDLAEASAFISRTHTPSRLVVAIAGDLEPAVVEAEAARLLGAIPAADPGPEPAEIRYSHLPPDTELQWDVDASAVFVLYPPPTDPEETLALTLWASTLYPTLSQAMGDARYSVATNSTIAPVGRLPVFAFSGVSPGDDSGQAASKLAGLIEAAAANPATSIAQARGMGAMLERSLEEGMTNAANQAGRDRLAAQVGAEQAERLVIGNTALELGLQWHAFGEAGAARLAALRARDAGWWRAVIQRTVAPERRVVTRLVPAAE